MTNLELVEILANEGVRFCRVNGFSIEPYGVDGAQLMGRIPLKLARNICEGVDTKVLRISTHHGSYLEAPDKWATNVDLADILSEIVHNLSQYSDALKAYDEKRAEYIRQAEQNGKLDDLYVLYMHLDTPEAVKHAIRVIRESGYVNQCLWNR